MTPTCVVGSVGGGICSLSAFFLSLNGEEEEPVKRRTETSERVGSCTRSGPLLNHPEEELDGDRKRTGGLFGASTRQSVSRPRVGSSVGRSPSPAAPPLNGERKTLFVTAEVSSPAVLHQPPRRF